MKKELTRILEHAIHGWRYTYKYWKTKQVTLNISKEHRESILGYIDLISDDEKHQLHDDLKELINEKKPFIYPRYYPIFQSFSNEHENLFMIIIGCIITSIYILQIYNKEYKRISSDKKHNIKKAIILLKKYTKDKDILKALNSYSIKTTKFNKDVLMSCIFYECTQALIVYEKVKLPKTRIVELCNEILCNVFDFRKAYRIYKYSENVALYGDFQLSRYTTKKPTTNLK